MRKYLKPAMEMEALEVKDIIMDDSDATITPGGLEGELGTAAPIEAVMFN